MNINFYFIKSDYIDYLKDTEINARGFTCVPNTEYTSRKKFLFGAVFENNGINYFVPVSSKIKYDDNSIIIKSKKDNTLKFGSLRFAYMIPVPNSCLIPMVINDIEDNERKRKVQSELAFCRKNIDKIKKQATKTYTSITKSTKKKLIRNSCDFKLLEQACKKYTTNFKNVPKEPEEIKFLEITKEELQTLISQGLSFISEKEIVQKNNGYILKLDIEKAKQVQKTLANKKSLMK